MIGKKLKILTSISAGTLISGHAYGLDEAFRDVSEVHEGDSLSAMAMSHLGEAYKSGHNNVMDLYLSLNDEILNADFVYPGQVINHPNEKEIRENLGEWAYNKYLEKLSRENRDYTIAKKGDTLGEIILEHHKVYFTVGADSMNDLYLQINPSLKSPDLIYVGDKIYHPTKFEIREHFGVKKRILASQDDLIKVVPKEVINRKTGFLEFSIENNFSKIDAINKINGQKAEIISDANPGFNLTVGHKSGKNVFGANFSFQKFKYLNGENITIKNNEFNIINYGLQYTHLQSRYLQLGVEFYRGEDFFQRGVDATTLEFFKIRSTKLGLVYGADLYQTDDFVVNLKLKYFKEQLEAEGSDSLDDGEETYAGLSFEFPREWGSAGVRVYYKQEKKESSFYKQEETFDGGLVFYNMDF